MPPESNYILVRRDVKHARLNVSENGIIRMIIPFTFTEEDIESLLSKKERWIQKKLTFFKGMSRINLQRNQLLLFGNRYNYYYDNSSDKKVLVNHDHKTITSQLNLLDIEIQQKWYKTIARKHLVSRTNELASRLNFKYNRLFIRNQKKKWGNCSPDKNISLNWRLIKAPQFVIDYIIVHELAHTIIMNHSTKFWTMLKSHYPDYQDAINWLDKYGNSL